MKMDDNYEMFKIVVVGSNGVGKTNFLKRYISNQYNKSEERTIGAQDFWKTAQVRKQYVKVQLFDVSVQQSYGSISKGFYKGASAILIVYDITNPESYIEVQTWMKLANQNIDQSDVVFMVVGNKADNEEMRKIPKDQPIKDYKDKFDIDCWEVSAKTGHNINKLFNQLLQRIYQKKNISNIKSQIFQSNQNQQQQNQQQKGMAQYKRIYKDTFNEKLSLKQKRKDQKDFTQKSYFKHVLQQFSSIRLAYFGIQSSKIDEISYPISVNGSSSNSLYSTNNLLKDLTLKSVTSNMNLSNKDKVSKYQKSRFQGSNTGMEQSVIAKIQLNDNKNIFERISKLLNLQYNQLIENPQILVAKIQQLIQQKNQVLTNQRFVVQYMMKSNFVKQIKQKFFNQKQLIRQVMFTKSPKQTFTHQQVVDILLKCHYLYKQEGSQILIKRNTIIDQNQQFQLEINQLKQILRDKEEQIVKLNMRHRQVRSIQEDQLIAQKGTLQGSINKLKQELDKNVQQKSTLLKENNALLRQENNLIKEISNLSKSLQNQQKQKNKLNNTNQENLTKIRQLTTKIESYQQTIQQYQKAKL